MTVMTSTLPGFRRGITPRRRTHNCTSFQTVLWRGLNPSPWLLEPVVHRFEETHTKWVPIIPPPLQVVGNENVVTTSTARGISRFTLPLLAEFGHLSLQHSTSGSAEPAAMATDPPTEPLPLLPESPVLEDDAIHVDNDQNTLAKAEMVE